MPALHEELTALTVAHSDAVGLLAKYVERVNELLIMSSPPPPDPSRSTQHMRLTAAHLSKMSQEEVADYQKIIRQTEQAVLDQHARIQQVIQEYPGLTLRMALIYRVAMFDAFLSDVQVCVLAHHPEFLAKNKDHKLAFPEIVDAMEQNRLIEVMAEQIADSTSRRNTIVDRLTKLGGCIEVGFKLEPPLSDALTEVIARRNLFTHANGVVDRAYRTMVPGTPHALGERLEVTYLYWNNAQILLRAVTTNLLQAIFSRHLQGITAPTI